MKQAISGITLVISIVGIYWFILQLEMTTSNTGCGIAILIMGVLCLISMFGLVAFSNSGWKLEGTSDEWIAAALMNPLILIFYKNKEKENSIMIEKENQKWDEEYWNRRN